MVRVVARNSKHDEIALRRKVVVTGGSNLCGSHLINRGITQTGRNVTIEFTGTGPRTGFTCRLDRKKSYSCKCNDKVHYVYTENSARFYWWWYTVAIAGNFRGRKLSQIGEKLRFLQRKLSRIATESRNSQKFSPSKVSRYMIVYTLSFSRLSALVRTIWLNSLRYLWKEMSFSSCESISMNVCVNLSWPWHRM